MKGLCYSLQLAIASPLILLQGNTLLSSPSLSPESKACCICVASITICVAIVTVSVASDAISQAGLLTSGAWQHQKSRTLCSLSAALCGVPEGEAGSEPGGD